MNRQGMNKTRFCLKTAIDDFKHESSRIFLDFRVAFGSLPHNIMIEALYEIDLPKPYINMIKDIYSGSFFQVICGDQLTNPTSLLQSMIYDIPVYTTTTTVKLPNFSLKELPL